MNSSNSGNHDIVMSSISNMNTLNSAPSAPKPMSPSLLFHDDNDDNDDSENGKDSPSQSPSKNDNNDKDETSSIHFEYDDSDLYGFTKDNTWGRKRPWFRTFYAWIEILIISALMMLPSLLLYLFVQFPTYNITKVKGDFVSSLTNPYMEFFRWSLIFTLLYDLYIIFHWFFGILPGMIIGISRRIYQHEPSAKLRRILINMKLNRKYFVWIIFLIKIIVIFRLFLYQDYIDYRILFSSEPTRIKDVLKYQKNLRKGHKIEWFSLIGLIFFTYLSLSHYIICLIKNSFGKRTVKERFEKCNLKMEIIKTLYNRVFIDRSIRLEWKKQGIKEAEKVALTIFQGHSHDKGYVESLDFRSSFPEELYEDYFELIDMDSHGRLKKDHLIKYISDLYEEEGKITKTIESYGTFIRGIESFLWSCALIAGSVTSLFIFNRAGMVFFASFGFTVLGILLLFKDSAKRMIDSVFFILGDHFYDVGDKIIIGGNRMIVKDIGMYRTTLMKISNGTMITMSNASICTEKVVNENKSPIITDVICMEFNESISMEQIRKIREKLMKWLLGEFHEFSGKCIIEPREDQNNGANVNFQIKNHGLTTTLNDIKERRLKIKARTREIIEEEGLDLKNIYL